MIFIFVTELGNYILQNSENNWVINEQCALGKGGDARDY